MESNAIVSAWASAVLSTTSDPAPTAGYTNSGASVGAAHSTAAAAAVPPSSASQSAGMSNCYVFKSRLQEYSQKVGYTAPGYHTLKEGPSHDPVFRSSVTVNNVKYDSLPGFFNRKIAEQSAAEVALIEIHKSGYMTECIPTVHETGLCKNMLQEYAQKMNYAIPAYVCTKQPSGPAPFICTVDIGGIQYIGAAARTKKEAEIKAARTALLAIERSSQTSSNGASQYTVLPGTKKVLGASQPGGAQKALKPKKTGFKKKFSKRKFPRRDGDGSAQLNQDQPGNNGTDVDVTGVPTAGNDVNPPNQDQSGNNGSDVDVTGVPTAGNDVNPPNQDQPGNNGTVDVTGVPTAGNDVNPPNQDQPGNNGTDVYVTGVPTTGNDVNPGEGLNSNEGEQASDKVNGEHGILTQDSNNMLAVETNGYMQDAQQLESVLHYTEQASLGVDGMSTINVEPI